MKVILLQHVKGRGRKGDILEVSDGFAQNSLIPQGLAKIATPEEINKLKLAQQSKNLKSEKEKNLILEALGILNGKTLTIQEKVNEKGSLYRAITNKEIITEIKKQHNLNLPESILADKYAIKEKGDYHIELTAYDRTVSLLLTLSSK